MASNFYSYNAQLNNGTDISMEDFSGKVVLIVNTASKCGFTPQYGSLQELYEKYNEKGLEILGFPCDQFAHQEPGSDEDIQQFCKINFGVTFPLFKKVNVNGKDADPLYKFLRKELPGKIGNSVKWNFTKFLIDREGNPVKRFSPKTSPENLENDIISLL
ncbi:MAG: glutathione peroxidase [Spirochaetales bacterium]|uniref:Glutathione peroxidase n=1 Tax=Candidatus Thalassospirochaeta sargassi TaxID=3119039 RepID=A0AAJ1IBS8_9SPIO|nr:glutathione peroxidase [Spirochaetales bacterium]